MKSHVTIYCGTVAKVAKRKGVSSGYCCESCHVDDEEFNMGLCLVQINEHATAAICCGMFDSTNELWGRHEEKKP